MEILCPVCNAPLTKSGTNITMYHCINRSVEFPELGTLININDATLFVGENGVVDIMIIDIPPYSFYIKDMPDQKQTRIRKWVKLGSSGLVYRGLVCQDILKIDEAIKMPWGNREKILERVNLLMLFS